MDEGTVTWASCQRKNEEIPSNIDDTDTILMQIQEKAAMVGVTISISELRRLTQVVDVGRLDTEKMQAVIDRIIEIAEQAQRKRCIRADTDLRRRLGSYATASFMQRMAMVSTVSTLAYRQTQSRKLVRKYNRR